MLNRGLTLGSGVRIRVHNDAFHISLATKKHVLVIGFLEITAVGLKIRVLIEKLSNPPC